MFVDGECSIYDDRPQTCRDYDCRIFAATGIELTDKPLVVEQTRRWDFDASDELARVQQQALRACAEFLRIQAHNLPPGSVPTNPTHLAMLAISVHELFIERESGAQRCGVPDIDVVADALTELMTVVRLAP